MEGQHKQNCVVFLYTIKKHLKREKYSAHNRKKYKYKGTVSIRKLNLIEGQNN